MLEEVLPKEVRSAEVLADVAEARLFAEEAALLINASAKRRVEFATVRACAREALSELGFEAAALPPGEGGAPQWPKGAVGSMTHCDGYRGAAVARAEEFATVGIDAEVHEPLPHGVLGLIASTDEHVMLTRLASVAPSVHWDRLLFSAKETVYKAWFPLTRKWLNFRDAGVMLHVDGAFSAVVLGEHRFTGRWLARGGFIVAAISVPVDDWPGHAGQRHRH